MALEILAAQKGVAVISKAALDPKKVYDVEIKKADGTYKCKARQPKKTDKAVLCKTPSGWGAKPGEKFDGRAGKRSPLKGLTVVTDAEFDKRLKEARGQAPAGGAPAHNGHGPTAEDLKGVLSFPLPIRSADSASGSGPLEARARRLLQLTLGPISDYASADVLKRALARRTEQVEAGGVELVRWRDGLGGVTDVEVDVTGERAGELSLAVQVRDIAGEIVETLCPVFPNRDPRVIETTREVLRGLLDEVVEELSRPELSTAVVRTLATGLKEALIRFGVALGYADKTGKIDESAVIVGAQETELTRFRILQRWIGMEAAALQTLSAQTPTTEFGFGIHRLEQYLDGSGQAATYVRTVLDQYVDFTALERRNYPIKLDKDGEISLEALLERVENRIAVSFRAQVAVAGRTAVRAGIPSLRVAHTAADSIVANGDKLPKALKNPIVQEGLHELEEQLKRALETAEEVAP